METLRAGVIGVGEVGVGHARCYAEARGAKLVGVADTNLERAHKMADELAVPAYSDYHELLSKVDIVSIAVPQHLHLECTRAAAEHDCHVLLEKPIARTVPEAREIIQVCRKRGVTLMIGFTHRFHVELRTARQKITEGRLGKIGVALDYMSFGAHPLMAWNWRRDIAGGGAMIRDGIHGIDRLRWLIGSEPTVVCALCTNFAHEGIADVEDGAVAIIRFKNGTVASMVQAWPSVKSPTKCDLELYGSEGVIRIKTWASLEYTDRDTSYLQTRQRENNLQLEVQEFVDAVRGNREPAVTGEDGLAALATIVAIYRSAETGRGINVSDVM